MVLLHTGKLARWPIALFHSILHSCACFSVLWNSKTSFRGAECALMLLLSRIASSRWSVLQFQRDKRLRCGQGGRVGPQRFEMLSPQQQELRGDIRCDVLCPIDNKISEVGQYKKKLSVPLLDVPASVLATFVVTLETW